MAVAPAKEAVIATEPQVFVRRFADGEEGAAAEFGVRGAGEQLEAVAVEPCEPFGGREPDKIIGRLRDRFDLVGGETLFGAPCPDRVADRWNFQGDRIRNGPSGRKKCNHNRAPCGCQEPRARGSDGRSHKVR